MGYDALGVPLCSLVAPMGAGIPGSPEAGPVLRGGPHTLPARNTQSEEARVGSAEDTLTTKENQHMAPYFKHGLIFSQCSESRALKTSLAFFSDSADTG